MCDDVNCSFAESGYGSEGGISRLVDGPSKGSGFGIVPSRLGLIGPVVSGF
jgi:hypothetical protein